MSRIEKYNADPSIGLDTRLTGDMVAKEQVEVKEVIIPPFEYNTPRKNHKDFKSLISKELKLDQRKVRVKQ